MASKFEIQLSASLNTASEANLQKQATEIGKKLNIPVNITADGTGISNINKSLNDTKKNLDGVVQSSDLLDNAFGKFLRWQIIGDIIHGVIDALGSMVDAVFDLDKSLVEFNKVTDLSESQLNDFVESAYEVGEAVGRTGTEVINAATEFAKAGYEDQATQLAQVALEYQNIADSEVSAADAASLIISQMKAFNIAAEDSEQIIDELNEVSNKYAVSTSDLKARSCVQKCA